MSAGATAAGRTAPWSPVTLTPVVVPDGLLVLRSPTLADGPSWSAARLANRAWLERAFPAWGADWVAEQSQVAWAQRWARLRRTALSGQARSFVMTLDGQLIGEIGIDAVDEASSSGEASVWMVRAHGSPAVMNVACLLLIEQVFTGPRRLARILSPVATTSRSGRSPGLRAVGFEIEATIPRRVGSDLVDHDIWVLHNTAASREVVATALHSLRAPDRQGAITTTGTTDTTTTSSSTPSRRALAPIVGRAALREARDGVRRVRASVAARRNTGSARPLATPGSSRPASLRPAVPRDLARAGRHQVLPTEVTWWSAESDQQVQALVGYRTDAGTATTEVFATARPGSDRDLLSAAVGAVLDDVRPGAQEQRVLVVRIPLGAAAGTVPDADLLTGLGLELIATYRGNPEGSHGWEGEEVWRAAHR